MSTKTICFCFATICASAFLGYAIDQSNAYESAKYAVLESDSPFEIREYPDLVLAATNMRLESRRDNGSFMRLFRYISGANANKQRVAMTTPVFVESEHGITEGQMGFVLPTEVAKGRVPEPANEQVQIRKRAGGRFAVVQFNGRMNSDSVPKAEKALRDWMKGKGFIGADNIESAGYDPPWTPGRNRRNEVLIRLKAAEPKNHETR